MRSRPGFPTRQASAPICMAALIANVIKASSPWAAHKGRTYGRTAPVWGQQRKRVPLTAGSFHIWESQESVSRRVGISLLVGTCKFPSRPTIPHTRTLPNGTIAGKSLRRPLGPASLKACEHQCDGSRLPTRPYRRISANQRGFSNLRMNSSIGVGEREDRVSRLSSG
jgi:hypothetical protein